MRASEKLKALDGELTPPPPWEKGWGDSDELVDLRNALPQIVAVVEAAERKRDSEIEATHYLIHDPACPCCQAQADVWDALTLPPRSRSQAHPTLRSSPRASSGRASDA